MAVRWWRRLLPWCRGPAQPVAGCGTFRQGDAAHPLVRSRLVCTEVRRKGVEAIFAATPPLESLRCLLMLLSQSDPGADDDPLCLGLADVSRAHFYARATRDVYIQLPKEDARSGERDVCGKLLRTPCTALSMPPRSGESTIRKFWLAMGL